MYMTSDVTGKTYQAEDAVFFRNLVQSSFYISNGATILDIFTDSDGLLVIVFPRDEHKILIKKWVDNKKNKEHDALDEEES